MTLPTHWCPRLVARAEAAIPRIVAALPPGTERTRIVTLARSIAAHGNPWVNNDLDVGGTCYPAGLILHALGVPTLPAGWTAATRARAEADAARIRALAPADPTERERLIACARMYAARHTQPAHAWRRRSVSVGGVKWPPALVLYALEEP